MANYRVYLVEERGRKPAHDITSDSDAEALIRARSMVVDGQQFEVWQGQRMVAIVDHGRTGGAAA